VDQFYNILIAGIYVGKHKFIELAYSNSQIKNHSIWMICETEHFSKEDIEKAIGDYKTEENPLKQLARKGQSFASTKFIVEIEEKDI